MRIVLSKTSLKYLQRLEKGLRYHIVSAIEGLPEKGDIKKIKGPGPLSTYRLRTGKFRVLYVLEKDLIRVIDIDTRGDIYK